MAKENWKASIAKANISLMLAAALACALMMIAGDAWAAESESADGLHAAASASTARKAAASPVALEDGIYQIRSSATSKRAIAIEGASVLPGANVVIAKKKNRANAEKFRIVAVADGYYRISSALASTALTVQGGSSDDGANVLMRKYRGKTSQLWKPVKTNYGIQFVNKRSGLALACTAKKPGANVLQTSTAPSKLKSWNLVRTSVDMTDCSMYLSALQAAPFTSGVKLSNITSGYKIGAGKRDRLAKAVRACRASGIRVAFAMVDARTGMTVTSRPDNVSFGASTIKGLYVTYLFERHVEKGRLDFGSIEWLARQAVVHSDNSAYQTLRARYGSQAGFDKWLRKAGVGSLPLWASYSPRTLASAWVNMLAYSQSGGAYVKSWRKMFNHPDMSVIHDALDGRRATYTKSGWMFEGGYGTVLNDAGVVCDSKGGRYILSIMTNAYPGGASKEKVQRVVKALDAIHKDMARVG